MCSRNLIRIGLRGRRKSRTVFRRAGNASLPRVSPGRRANATPRSTDAGTTGGRSFTDRANSCSPLTRQLEHPHGVVPHQELLRFISKTEFDRSLRTARSGSITGQSVPNMTFSRP